MMKQSLFLAKMPHVVVATPGRLADHLRSTDTISLDRIRFLVSMPHLLHTVYLLPFLLNY